MESPIKIPNYCSILLIQKKPLESLKRSKVVTSFVHESLREIPDIHPFKYRLRYFKNEFTKSINQIRHKSIKAVLKNFDKDFADP